MKVKQVKLDIQSENEFIRETAKAMKDMAAGKSVKPDSVISFDSLKTMRKFITDERLKILKTIRRDHPASIYALAKILKRDTKNVSDDVHYLSELGLLKLEKTKDGRSKTKPVMEYEKILVEISV